MYKILAILFVIKSSMCGCSLRSDSNERKAKIDFLGQIPSVINESSGLEKSKIEGQFLTLNDSGGDPVLFQIAENGNLSDTKIIPNSKNVDWEDLTQDNKGSYYIGDFGNNNQDRRDLVIYKWNGTTTEKINFNYGDQEFLKKEDKNFDCEAFFWFNEKLYLFTKTWDKKKKITKMYVLPDVAGSYEISPKEILKEKGQVTSAAISPDNSRFALLFYGKVLIFKIINGKIDLKNPDKCIKIEKAQSEAIVFEKNNRLIYTTEKGKVYSIEI